MDEWVGVRSQKSEDRSERSDRGFGIAGKLKICSMLVAQTSEVSLPDD
jgi:hypothetical protein